jgi:pimeloyl-ACP methyl ester carboxylesterase
MRRTLSIALAVAAVAAAVVPGVSAAATPSTLKWGPCPADAAAPGLECSTLAVPLDYQHPDGRKIEITISRLASKNPAQRRGVLLTNPGGPGEAGLNFPLILAKSGLPQSVLDTYDVIGFDPRGIGHSTPVTCDLTLEQMSQGVLVLPYANTAADVAKAAGEAKIIARQCATSKTGSMLPYVTTANTARDMDRIREALGEAKLSYDGSSYGTYLGAVYTTLFPQRSDRIVLDSNMGPGGYDVTGKRLFARGFQDRFPDFAKFAAGHPEYGLGTTPEQVTAKYFDLAARLDRTPVQGVDGSLLRGITFNNLYSDGFRSYLAAIWHALDTNQPLPPPLVPAPSDPDNLISSHLYVICGDSRWPRSVQTYQRAVAVDRVQYPMYGGSSADIGPCAFWPDPVEPQVRIGDRGPADVLMVQNLRDPGTPLVGARQLRQAFGDRARMVTADQGGHGVYPYGENKCANNAVTTFLTTGQRPSHDLACAAGPN